VRQHALGGLGVTARHHRRQVVGYVDIPAAFHEARERDAPLFLVDAGREQPAENVRKAVRFTRLDVARVQIVDAGLVGRVDHRLSVGEDEGLGVVARILDQGALRARGQVVFVDVVAGVRAHVVRIQEVHLAQHGQVLRVEIDGTGIVASGNDKHDLLAVGIETRRQLVGQHRR
jgi:hypothetical protein